MTQPIVISMGDPTGVGPEIIMKAWLSGALDSLAHRLLVAGDLGALRGAATLCGVEADVAEEENGLASHRLIVASRSLPVKSLSDLDTERLEYGNPDLACGRAMVDYIQWACDRCLSQEAAAMVTAPINKAAVRAAGFEFPGHTEFLAALCGVDKVVMMLAGDRLKVCLVTTHLAVREVPDALTRQGILETVQITDGALRRFFGMERPRLAVLALNPHAGENGLFGEEEKDIILPAISAAQTMGIEASGPHSADALFHFAQKGDFDAVVCMYHDQGLIPLKLLHFDDGVNVTLGLPIVRTSVDHGTAYDIAGTGAASCASLVAAARLAAGMAGTP